MRFWSRVASLAVLILTSLLAQRNAPTIPRDKGYAVQEIRDGLYWVTDGAYNTMFLVWSEGVIAVDPLPTLGPRYLKAIAEVTKKPVTHVVYSHEHTDHIGAASLFPKGVTILAQKETAKILADRQDPRRPVPTIAFEDHYTLKVGEQALQLDYAGVNHERGNIFIYAPRQKVLMIVDIVYPGFMPYKNLGIVDDVPGYLEAHRVALRYDFDTLVAGHVSRLGKRHDVEVSMAFANELKDVAASLLGGLPFPAFLQSTTLKGRDGWDLHNEYEKELVDRCYRRMAPQWSSRLTDTETYLRDNCWAMIESITVQMPPRWLDPALSR